MIIVNALRKKKSMFSDRDKISPVLQMIYADKLHRAVAEQAMAPFGLHRSQHMAMMLLLMYGEPLSQVEMAEVFRISPAAMAVTLKKLNAAGLIDRVPHKGNNRANDITLSASGQAVMQETVTLMEQVDKAMLKDIPEEELQVFVRVLTKMTHNLKAAYPEAAGEQPAVKHGKIKETDA